MIDENSYGTNVAEELGLDSSATGYDVTDAVSLDNTAYGEDVATAINNIPDEPVTIKVCQYNIGHFNMGYAAAPTGSNPSTSTVLINSSKSDGYPSSVDRNYATQLSRWTNKVNTIDADILGLPEWNNYFGYNGGSVVTTVDSGIFDGYNLSVGKSAISGWWQNTLASKYTLSNVQDIDLGSTNNLAAYVRVGTITLGGKTVKVGVTHLNWNHPNGTGGADGSYASRQKEIKELVKLFQDDEYLILMGDFNTEGPVYASNVSYDPSVRDYEAGLAEFDPFINGFTEDGVAYQGGFTLANSESNPLLTSPATNSRPDLSRPQYPYCYIDNIIVKGFSMSNIQVIDDGTITDHCGVTCELTMI